MTSDSGGPEVADFKVDINQLYTLLFVTVNSIKQPSVFKAVFKGQYLMIPHVYLLVT